MDTTALLAALPFLPIGKGALILIFGGLAVLPLSLLLSRITSTTQWVSGIAQRAAHLGLGPCHIVAADAHRCVVSFASCSTCRQPGPHAGGCDRERRGLQLAVHLRAPEATVAEVSCNEAGQGRCTFEIRRGRSA